MSITVIDYTKPTMLIETPTCSWCGEKGELEVPSMGYLKRQARHPIQECFPEMDKALREQIVSGTHPECWTEMFGAH